MVRSYLEGVPASQAALGAYFAVGGAVAAEIHVPDGVEVGETVSWLEGEGIFVPEDVDGSGHNENFLLAMLPMEVVVPFMTAFPGVYVKSEEYYANGATISRAWWPEEIRAYENAVIAFYSCGVVIFPDDGDYSGVVVEEVGNEPVDCSGYWAEFDG